MYKQSTSFTLGTLCHRDHEGVPPLKVSICERLGAGPAGGLCQASRTAHWPAAPLPALWRDPPLSALRLQREGENPRYLT